MLVIDIPLCSPSHNRETAADVKWLGDLQKMRNKRWRERGGVEEKSVYQVKFTKPFMRKGWGMMEEGKEWGIRQREIEECTR